jgi:hypothetical protein
MKLNSSAPLSLNNNNNNNNNSNNNEQEMNDFSPKLHTTYTWHDRAFEIVLFSIPYYRMYIQFHWKRQK